MKKIFHTLDEIIKNKNPKKIGQGAFSNVILIKDPQNPQKRYAMKELLKKDEIEIKYIKQEITLHQQLLHKNIIKLEDYFETEKKMFIFLEYAENGDLFEYLKNHKISDNQKLRFFQQICQAIKYIHSKNIMHRDLKPENILVNSQNVIKLCDFGWSAFFDENEVRNSFCGTYEYMAPEIFQSYDQTKKTDIWSLGILLYEIFHNYSPFRFKNIKTYCDDLKLMDLRFKEGFCKKIEKLVRKILKFEQRARPDIEEILSDELFLEIENEDFSCVEDKKIGVEKIDFIKKNKISLSKAKSYEVEQKVKNFKKKNSVFESSFFKNKNFVKNLTKKNFKKKIIKTPKIILSNNNKLNFKKKNHDCSNLKNKYKNQNLNLKKEQYETNPKIEIRIKKDSSSISKKPKINSLLKKNQLNYKIKKNKNQICSSNSNKQSSILEPKNNKIIKRFLSPQPLIKKKIKNKRKTDLDFFLKLDKIEITKNYSDNFFLNTKQYQSCVSVENSSCISKKTSKTDFNNNENDIIYKKKILNIKNSKITDNYLVRKEKNNFINKKEDKIIYRSKMSNQKNSKKIENLKKIENSKTNENLKKNEIIINRKNTENSIKRKNKENSEIIYKKKMSNKKNLKKLDNLFKREIIYNKLSKKQRSIVKFNSNKKKVVRYSLCKNDNEKKILSIEKNHFGKSCFEQYNIYSNLNKNMFVNRKENLNSEKKNLNDLKFYSEKRKNTSKINFSEKNVNSEYFAMKYPEKNQKSLNYKILQNEKMTSKKKNNCENVLTTIYKKSSKVGKKRNSNVKNNNLVYRLNSSNKKKVIDSKKNRKKSLFEIILN